MYEIFIENKKIQKRVSKYIVGDIINTKGHIYLQRQVKNKAKTPLKEIDIVQYEITDPIQEKIMSNKIYTMQEWKKLVYMALIKLKNFL